MHSLQLPFRPYNLRYSQMAPSAPRMLNKFKFTYNFKSYLMTSKSAEGDQFTLRLRVKNSSSFTCRSPYAISEPAINPSTTNKRRIQAFFFTFPRLPPFFDTCFYIIRPIGQAAQ